MPQVRLFVILFVLLAAQVISSDQHCKGCTNRRSRHSSRALPSHGYHVHKRQPIPRYHLHFLVIRSYEEESSSYEDKTVESLEEMDFDDLDGMEDYQSSSSLSSEEVTIHSSPKHNNRQSKTKAPRKLFTTKDPKVAIHDRTTKDPRIAIHDRTTKDPRIAIHDRTTKDPKVAIHDRTTKEPHSAEHDYTTKKANDFTTEKSASSKENEKDDSTTDSSTKSHATTRLYASTSVGPSTTDVTNKVKSSEQDFVPTTPNTNPAADETTTQVIAGSQSTTNDPQFSTESSVTAKVKEQSGRGFERPALSRKDSEEESTTESKPTTTAKPREESETTAKVDTSEEGGEEESSEENETATDATSSEESDTASNADSSEEDETSTKVVSGSTSATNYAQSTVATTQLADEESDSEDETTPKANSSEQSEVTTKADSSEDGDKKTTVNSAEDKASTTSPTDDTENTVSANSSEDDDDKTTAVTENEAATTVNSISETTNKIQDETNDDVTSGPTSTASYQESVPTSQDGEQVGRDGDDNEATTENTGITQVAEQIAQNPTTSDSVAEESSTTNTPTTDEQNDPNATNLTISPPAIIPGEVPAAVQVQRANIPQQPETTTPATSFTAPLVIIEVPPAQEDDTSDNRPVQEKRSIAASKFEGNSIHSVGEKSQDQIRPVCEVAGDFGIRNECTHYFSCKIKGDIPVVKFCAPYHHFDHYERKCRRGITGYDRQCEDPCEDGKLFIDRNWNADGSTYLKCVDGVPLPFSCPPSQIFSSSTMQCV